MAFTSNLFNRMVNVLPQRWKVLRRENTIHTATDSRKAFSRQNVLKDICETMSIEPHTAPRTVMCTEEGKQERKDIHRHKTRSISSGHIMEGHDYNCQVLSAICLINKVNQRKLKVCEGSKGTQSQCVVRD